ncbi:anti-sigma factor [Halobacillus sp. ACCC02827]|uniref:anti-sigma factor n=1 Tax=Halobacillus sp. ACCC02827 TaxID=3052090 RepID=UPI0025704ED5|nr:anti-sigma factor [Halobacillus sp. ACCC02827]WJE16097.1 anti-sigma factor [Halobacillus sp. ACCC02827]
MSRLCDELMDYFNGHLSEQEKMEFEEHLNTCSECREELEELQELTGELPFASDPITPPDDMKARVLGEVFQHEQDGRGDSSVIEEHSENVLPISKKKEHAFGEVKRNKKSSWFVRGLVAALIVSLAGNVWALMNEEKQVVQQEPEEISDSTDEVLRKVTLQGETTTASASAAMVRQSEGEVLSLQADQLEPLDGEEVYQVWLINGETPYRAGTFKANESGEGAVTYNMEQLPEDTEWDMVAVSKEPDASSETPQGEVILSAGL